jgi:REP element-mobilizing transposase RayT
MFHLVAGPVPGRALFVREVDGVLLYEALGAAFPEVVALCVMPDHVHLILPHDDPGNRLHRVLQGFANARNRRTGRSGPLWAPRPPPVAIPNALHLRRTIRYVHLNPCRERLVNDPLAWPFSTHRDRVGFAARPLVAVDRDPAGFHAFVSGDPSVDPAGTPLPSRQFRDLSVHEVADAVCSVFRVPSGRLSERHAARASFAKVAWHSGIRDAEQLRTMTLLGRTRLHLLVRDVPRRGAQLVEPLEACARAVGDPRFHAMSDRDERRTNARWAKYRSLSE